MPMRRHIFDPLQDIRRELDDVFERFLGEGFMPMSARAMKGATISPEIDVSVEDDTLRIDADLPGVDPGDIECTIKDGILTIKGERKLEQQTPGAGGMLQERRFGRFERRITMPEGIDEENLEARFDKGVLTVLAHMKPGVGQTRRIRISGAEASQQGAGQDQSQQPQPRTEQSSQSPGQTSPSGNGQQQTGSQQQNQ